MRRTTIRIPAERIHVREPLTTRVLRALGVTALVIIGAIVFSIVMIEFMAGCGERTYYADGTWRTNECVFMPYETVEGRW